MRASGSEPAQQMLPAASGNWAKARQAIGAAVRDHHGARAAQEGDAGLAAWLVQASGEVQAADGKLESARAAYQQVGGVQGLPCSLGSCRALRYRSHRRRCRQRHLVRSPSAG